MPKVEKHTSKGVFVKCQGTRGRCDYCVTGYFFGVMKKDHQHWIYTSKRSGNICDCVFHVDDVNLDKPIKETWRTPPPQLVFISDDDNISFDD